MINFIKRKIEKYKLMTTRQEFGYKLKTFTLEGYGDIEYAHWLNPFSYSMLVSKSKIDFFKTFIKEGDFVIDIGANIGGNSLPMALTAGSAGIALALEPNPFSFKILLVNSRLNKDKLKIIPLPFAATKEDGEFFYNSSEATFNNGGISKLKSSFHGKYELEEKIKGINLEHLLRKDYRDLLNSLTCIKVDTEGYDKDILLSIRGIIDEFKPTVIFEVFNKLNKDDRYELFDLFADNGYDLFKFDGFDITAPIKQLKRDDMSNWNHFEAYATYTKSCNN